INWRQLLVPGLAVGVLVRRYLYAPTMLVEVLVVVQPFDEGVSDATLLMERTETVQVFFVDLAALVEHNDMRATRDRLEQVDAALVAGLEFLRWRRLVSQPCHVRVDEEDHGSFFSFSLASRLRLSAARANAATSPISSPKKSSGQLAMLPNSSSFSSSIV